MEDETHECGYKVADSQVREIQMTIGETINKAVSADLGATYLENFSEPEIFLQPLFWQSLGKALGWEPKEWAIGSWRNRWHRFIDYLADGKSAEEFFAGLEN